MKVDGKDLEVLNPLEDLVNRHSLSQQQLWQEQLTVRPETAKIFASFPKDNFQWRIRKKRSEIISAMN